MSRCGRNCSRERNGLVMDRCLNCYGEFCAAAYSGTSGTMRMLLIVLAFCMMLFWTGTCTAPADRPAAAGNETAAAGDTESGTVAAVSESAAVTAVSGGMLDGIPADAEGIISEIVIPVSSAVPLHANKASAESEAPDILEISDVPETPDIPETSDVPETPDIPEISAEPETPAVPDIPEAPEAAVIPNIPAVPDNLQNDISSLAGTINGFSIDENGLICGVADPQLAVSDGVMKLPSEGCTGVRAGAFSDGLSSVIEVYIPSNIKQIECGAFAGLQNVEWYTAEPGSGFSDEMGVLLSDNGTSIFAFPSGRTGSYKVPETIAGFAENAFADVKITTLDLTECTAATPSGLPGHIKVIRRDAY